MVHSPNDALQSHKVSGQNSPRGRVGEQKKKIAKKPQKKSCKESRKIAKNREKTVIAKKLQKKNWTRVRATCRPLEPCACGLWTTRALCAGPADHRSRAGTESHKINTSSVLEQVLIRVRVRVRVTKLVYQIGLTTPF